MYKSLFREANHRECFVVSPTFRAYIKHISITTRATDKAPASTIDVDVECVAIGLAGFIVRMLLRRMRLL